jgi:hypothetical protein
MQGDGNEGMRECHQMVTFAFALPKPPCSARLHADGIIGSRKG